MSLKNKPQKSNQTQNYIASPKHLFLYPYLDIGADEEVNKYMAIHHCVVKRVEAKSIRAQVVTTHPLQSLFPHSSPGEVLHHFNLTAYMQLDF